MFEYVRKLVDAVEVSLKEPNLSEALSLLRCGLGLDDFGEIMISMPREDYPKLSSALPRMATEEVQANWTGSSGMTLLRQSCSFVRSAAFTYTALTGRSLSGARMLDYGCGYGRLARLMWYFTDRVWGVDPWDRSIAICQQDGLGENFRQSKYLPDDLPFSVQRFDFIYAFSVFTHTSLRATRSALEVCRRYLSPDGVMLITIRPIEYWDLDKSVHGLDNPAPLRRAHREGGFAFSPFNLPPVDGDITYGNMSMSIEWLAANIPGWRIASVDRSLDDAYQIYVALMPR